MFRLIVGIAISGLGSNFAIAQDHPSARAETAAKALPPSMNAKLASALGRPNARIVFYGTSLTRSGKWPELLAAELSAHYPGIQTINAAENGKNSRWGLAKFEELVLRHEPDVLLIEFSTNDAGARTAMSDEEARGNLMAMIDQLLARRPHAMVILQVMNPVIGRPEGHAGYRPYLARFQEITREVARERGVILVDHAPAWDALLAQGEVEFRRYVPDGLHPSLDGYRAFMLPTLRPVLGLPPPQNP